VSVPVVCVNIVIPQKKLVPLSLPLIWQHSKLGAADGIRIWAVMQRQLAAADQERYAA